jgi:hypothetical protein
MTNESYVIDREQQQLFMIYIKIGKEEYWTARLNDIDKLNETLWDSIGGS